ncbi:lipoyl(octanoyl) transferase LipB [Nitrospira sp. M1]
MARRSGCLLNLSHVRYQDAWDFQRALLQERAEDRCADTMLLVEHEPVFTLGRTAKDEHWKRSLESLASQGFGLYPIERGGSVTYHGPGQVVAYPIVRLRDFCQGPKAYVGMLQEVILRVLAEWNIRGRLKEKFPGVWVEERGSDLTKIAAIGVRITKGVTMHGLALNGNVDLKPFEFITPCGIEGCQVTSMKKILGQKVDTHAVRERVAYHFAEVFGIKWTERRHTLPRMKSGSCLSVL